MVPTRSCYHSYEETPVDCVHLYAVYQWYSRNPGSIYASFAAVMQWGFLHFPAMIWTTPLTGTGYATANTRIDIYIPAGRGEEEHDLGASSYHSGPDGGLERTQSLMCPISIRPESCSNGAPEDKLHLLENGVLYYFGLHALRR